MALNTVGKQWANIVSLFEQAEQLQRKHNSEMVAAGIEVDDYNVGRLCVLELGVAHAKGYHKAFRFKFWLKPVLSENHTLLEFLLGLHALTATDEFADKSYRDGMTTALNNWASWIAMEDGKSPRYSSDSGHGELVTTKKKDNYL